MQYGRYLELIEDYCAEVPVEDFSVITGPRALAGCSARQLARYQKMLENGGDSAKTYYRMAGICAINGALNNALKFFQLAGEHGDPEIRELALRERSKIFTRMGRPDRAAAEFRKAKEILETD